ncbi:MAG: hypothetical protein AB1486_27635 [Planctomycetota bacterium]
MTDLTRTSTLQCQDVRPYFEGYATAGATRGPALIDVSLTDFRGIKWWRQHACALEVAAALGGF